MRAAVLASILLVFAGQGCASEKPPLDPRGEPMEQLTIVTDSGRHTFWMEIADDAAERQRGLMFRPPLPDDQGMLFEYPEAAERAIWMRNTPSSLDVLYVRPDGQIISIARHTTPYSDTLQPSNGPASGIIELRAGRAEEIGAKPGDRVEHPHFGR
ncbi:DUF192 domain-containing protein [Brevundimonas sp.]|jgi:uncharacterized membrane protein (UPF0127 family)|uniref:DUF192 domain-containing protein n=1 Tax=Brevundimonas sp. TaxID=1871086 RepID=UPI00391D44EC